MSWLRMVLHSLLGRTRYHDQANDVNLRMLRLGLLEKRLDVYRRSHHR